MDTQLTIEEMARELASWTGREDKIPAYIAEFQAMEQNIPPSDPEVQAYVLSYLTVIGAAVYSEMIALAAGVREWPC